MSESYFLRTQTALFHITIHTYQVRTMDGRVRKLKGLALTCLAPLSPVLDP